jgi:hypothetical protein
MRQEGFQVVAELYRLLATFQSSAIADAARLPGISDNLRAALSALHREAVARGGTSNANDKASERNAAKPGPGARSLEPLELLLDPKRFPTKQDLVEFCRLLGVGVDIDAKSSRERIARRIARFVDEDQQARERMYDLAKRSTSDQTSGWIKLIRRGQ